MRGPYTLSVGAIVVVAAAVLPPPRAADPGVQRILDAGLRSDGAYSTLAWLTDRIGPRLAGSDNLDKAVAWGVSEMRAAGLENPHAESVMVPHWVRGSASGRILAPAEHPLVLLALGMSVGTPPGGVEGEVVEATSLDEVKALGEKAKGKIILFNKKMTANGGAMSGYGAVIGLRLKGASEAARVGAVGMLIRSLATEDLRLPHTGTLVYDDDAPRIPAAAVSPEDALLVHRLLASGQAVRVRFELGCRTLSDAPSANVVGEIPGKERPDEIVLIGGHLDSWDVGTGAEDDGAGCAIVLEAMRLIKALPGRPKRTIRAVLFTNEENGGRGGAGYAEAHAAQLGKHVAAIESDSGGARPLGFGVTAGPGAVERVRALAAPLAGIAADDVTEGGGGADISPLEAAGVPQMSLRQDTTHYFDIHHSMADTLDKIDPHDLAMNATAMALMAWELAQADPPLPRVPATDGK